MGKDTSQSTVEQSALRDPKAPGATPRTLDALHKDVLPIHHGSMSIGQLEYLKCDAPTTTKSTLAIGQKERLLSPGSFSAVRMRAAINGRAQTANRA